MLNKKNLITIALICTCTFSLSGCASIGRGIAEGLIAPKHVNVGNCRVTSDGFKGTETTSKDNDGKLHIMMIHGIGNVHPGYASVLADRLAFKTGLGVKGKTYKDIRLKSRTIDDNIGHLRIYYASNDNNSKEMFFYEYTWASINAPIKELIRFDIADGHKGNRTLLSKLVKSFINETGTDAVIYLGNDDASARVKEGVAQTICWMTTEAWMNLKDTETEGISCTIESTDRPRRKSYTAITHSLGSQILLDTLGGLASGEIGQDPTTGSTSDFIKKYTNDTNLEIFMFANQLPAIAMGKEKPKITNKIAEYCGNDAPLKDERMLNKLEIIAFSDPNDVLSYTLPPRFEQKYIDSRLCPDISNVVVNVAPLSNLFGSQVANPFEAHSNYQKDKRVLELIIGGTHEDNRTIPPDQGCYWVKEVIR